MLEVVTEKMGTPLPENEPGLLCGHCWGAGKAFGDGRTPKYITLTLSDLIPAAGWEPQQDPLLLAPQILSQAGTGCNYRLQTQTLLFMYQFSWDRTYCEVASLLTSVLYFLQLHGPMCALSLDGMGSLPSIQGAVGGKATITWNPDDLL